MLNSYVQRKLHFFRMSASAILQAFMDSDSDEAPPQQNNIQSNSSVLQAAKDHSRVDSCMLSKVDLSDRDSLSNDSLPMQEDNQTMQMDDKSTQQDSDSEPESLASITNESLLETTAVAINGQDNLPAFARPLNPSMLNVILLPHQLKALDWLLEQERIKGRGGILADDMGLGKTVSTISLILENRKPARITQYTKSTLIVLPVRLTLLAYP